MKSTLTLPESCLTSHGPHARTYAARLPADLNVLVFDDVGFAEALDDALTRAYRSMPFPTLPIIGDRRSQVALTAARNILAVHPQYSKRREEFDLVRAGKRIFDERTQLALQAYTNKERASIADVLLASDAVVVRSWTELARLASTFDVRPVRCVRAVAPPSHSLPAFRARPGALTILVWAPQYDGLDASMFAFALEELKAPTVVLCANAAQGERLGLRARFIDVHDPTACEALLDEVSVIVDASVDDPAFAIECAALGLPVAAHFGSGAFEYVDGLYAYDAWDYRSILHAALAALGGEPPQIRSTVPRPQDLVDGQLHLGPPATADPPRVSVVVATHNRHGILPRAIDSLARQTYPNVEVVVVNDGGRPVDTIVNRLAGAIVIDNVSPQGAVIAQNVGLARSSGKYIAFLSDDDYLFPTYVSRLVYALERTGGAVAAGMCVDSYLEPGESSSYDFIGAAIRPYRSTDPTDLHSIPHSMPAFVFVRRDVQLTTGSWNPQEPIYNDYDRLLRLSATHDVLWISHVVADMDVRLDRSNSSARVSVDDRIADLLRLWATYEKPNRPDIQRAQQTLLELYREQRPPHEIPLHRGVTRVERKKSVYRLD